MLRAWSKLKFLASGAKSIWTRIAKYSQNKNLEEERIEFANLKNQIKFYNFYKKKIIQKSEISRKKKVF